jgi:hypothetical protein
MWQCPKCETLNKDDQCIVCSERKPIEQNRKVEILPPQVYYKPVPPQNQVNNRYNTPQDKSYNDKIAVVIGAIIALGLFMFIVFMIASEYAA